MPPLREKSAEMSVLPGQQSHVKLVPVGCFVQTPSTNEYTFSGAIGTCEVAGAVRARGAPPLRSVSGGASCSRERSD